MTEPSDDVARNMAMLAEQIEPMFEAGRGLRARMKKRRVGRADRS